MRSGFTLIELLVTIVVMSILIGLVGFGAAGFQARVRDDERRTDMSNFALYLDSSYITGFSGIENGLREHFPTTHHLRSGDYKSLFPGLDIKNLQPPGVPAGTTGLVMATNKVESKTGILPQPTATTYVYQPMSPAGYLCSSIGTTCQRFNLYFYSEEDKSVQMLTSKKR